MLRAVVWCYTRRRGQRQNASGHTSGRGVWGNLDHLSFRAVRTFVLYSVVFWAINGRTHLFTGRSTRGFFGRLDGHNDQDLTLRHARALACGRVGKLVFTFSMFKGHLFIYDSGLFGRNFSYAHVQGKFRVVYLGVVHQRGVLLGRNLRGLFDQVATSFIYHGRVSSFTRQVLPRTRVFQRDLEVVGRFRGLARGPIYAILETIYSFGHTLGGTGVYRVKTGRDHVMFQGTGLVRVTYFFNVQGLQRIFPS